MSELISVNHRIQTFIYHNVSKGHLSQCLLFVILFYIIMQKWLILENHEFGYYVTIIMHLQVFQVICQLIELSQCLMFVVLLYYFQMSFSISYCVYYLCLCSQSSSSSGTINKIRTSCVVFLGRIGMPHNIQWLLYH